MTPSDTDLYEYLQWQLEANEREMANAEASYDDDAVAWLLFQQATILDGIESLERKRESGQKSTNRQPGDDSQSEAELGIVLHDWYV